MKLSATIVLAAVLLVAGCGADSTAPAPNSVPASAGVSGEFNDTDVMFLQMLGPHHTQGIAIVKVGAERSKREDLRVLANAIMVTQQEEVTRISGWLQTWKQPATADPASHAAHGAMPGTSEKQIAALRKTPDADFDRDFLDLLVSHQDDAVQLARMETASGVNPVVKAYAKQVDESRNAEIKQMLAFRDGTS
jgi:uncharacterized protein (DUF305 family)